MNYFVEQRCHPKAAHALACDLACHLYTRNLSGQVIVIADEPFSFMRVVRKEWLKLLHIVERERAKTLNVLRIKVLNQEIERMKKLCFSSKVHLSKSTDVLFVTPTILESPQLNCHTAYTTCPEIVPQKLSSYVRKNGLIVVYK